MDYSIEDVCSVVGMTRPHANGYLYRQHVAPEWPGPGKGGDLRLRRPDVFQFAVVKALSQAGVALKRCPLFWRVVAAQPDLSNVAIYVQERQDGSETDFKFARADGPRPADVPATAKRIDIGAIQDRVWRRLDNIDARRIAADPIAYPHRLPFVASHNPGAPWSVFLAKEAGELDAEAVARIGDAIEARSNILACGASKEALHSLVAVIDRAMQAANVAPEMVN